MQKGNVSIVRGEYFDCAICQRMDVRLMAFGANTILHSAAIMLLVQLVLGANIVSRALVPGVAAHACFGSSREGNSKRPESKWTRLCMCFEMSTKE